MESCASCHKLGGIAPFPLLTLEQTLAVAPVLAPSVQSRRMPPWSADNTGQCHTWDGARWLSDEEIAIISAWADGDREAGDPANGPQLPQEPPGLTQVSVTVAMAETYIPNEALSDDYRCFVVDYPEQAEKYLTAFEIRPGEPQVVHHVVLYGLQTPEDVARAEALDADAPGYGYTCFGGALVPGSTVLGVWAPGVRVSRFPAGTGLGVPATGKMVMQVHYNLAAGALPDRTELDLELADSVNKKAFLYVLAALDLSLPPGESSTEAIGELRVPMGLYQVWGHYPHMHTLGRSLRVELLRGSDPASCMLDIPRWDFDWQQFYNYGDGPMDILPGDTLRITCDYDTTSRDENVTWGEGTLDEMCLTFLYTTTGL
jgi:hypothetical protein